MDLNTIFLSLFGILLLYAGYSVWTNPTPAEFSPVRSGLLVAQDTGKSKQIQSKTGDASLAIQEVRRRIIHYFGRKEPAKIRETRTGKGSTTGAVETYFISYPTCCNIPCLPPCDVWYDAGYQDSYFDEEEHCNILEAEDGYGNLLDAGNQNTEVCPKVYRITCDGGDDEAEYTDLLIDEDGMGKYLDGGNQKREVCITK
jgi:hypothetical protein